MPIGTAFHEKTLALCESLNYREWSGYYTVSASLHGQSLPAHKVHVTDSGHARSVFVFSRQG